MIGAIAYPEKSVSFNEVTTNYQIYFFWLNQNHYLTHSTSFY